MVLVVTGTHLPQPFTHSRNRLMTEARQLQFNLVELRHQPLLRCFTPDDEGSVLPALPTVVREAQEGEGLWLSLPLLFPVEGGEPPELNQPCLLRM